jgi:hypothetical protein
MKPRSRSTLAAIVTLAALTAGLAGVTFAAPVGAETRTAHPDVTISTNKEFDKAHAVRSGSGTRSDPYVISGWQIGSLVIQNTNKWVTIRDNTIGGLILDWIGDRVVVRNNVVGDMRVNQNVPRTGAPTSGLIEWNAFRVVGQLRHWDGVFQKNIVGSNAENADTRANQAVNFDGFNGARFVNNTIYGFVDARLHGHHHSSQFGGHSHNHSTTAGHEDHAASSAAAKEMHRYRHHQVTIANNRIESTHQYALAYLDTDHANNDRTAASETDAALENPHLHFTRVHMLRNALTGAGILVNIFNAVDERHPWTERGLVHIEGNKIALGQDAFLNFRQLQGIEIRQARDADVKIYRNTIEGMKEAGALAFLEDGDQDAGVFLNNLDDAKVSVVGNRVSKRAFGVRAATMTDSVSWLVRDLRTSDVRERVYYDESVSNKPSS